MKILIVSQHFWPENFRINDLALGLKEKGHEVTVLTAKPNYPEGRFFKGFSFLTRNTEEYEGIKIIRVPVIPRFSGKSGQLILNYFSFVFFACLITPFRCRGKYDIVFSYLTSPVTAALPAILMKKIKQAKLYLWVQDLWPESVSATGAIKSPAIINGIGRLVRFIYNRADRILVSSKSFKKSVSHYLSNKKTPVDYFPNSVEALYKPAAETAVFREKYNIPKGFVVMFAGNVGYAQDFPTILEAADQLRDNKDIQFVILGDGRHFSWVREQVLEKQLTETVHLLGRFPMEAMPAYFAYADVMLVTLKNEPVFLLTVPCKIQSYLACGKPILAAMGGEGAQLVKEAEAGTTCEPGDPVALARAVSHFYLLGEAERKRMGEAAYQYYLSHFQREMLLNQLDEWIGAEKAKMTFAAEENI